MMHSAEQAAGIVGTAASRELITRFYTEFFNRHKTEAALTYVKEDYIQHNPGVGQGRAALIEAFAEKFKNEPDFHLNIEMIIAENDMVAVYLKNIGSDGNEKCKLVDIYRIEDGMLAEHWDIIQKAVT